MKKLSLYMCAIIFLWTPPICAKETPCAQIRQDIPGRFPPKPASINICAFVTTKRIAHQFSIRKPPIFHMASHKTKQLPQLGYSILFDKKQFSTLEALTQEILENSKIHVIAHQSFLCNKPISLSTQNRKNEHLSLELSSLLPLPFLRLSVSCQYDVQFKNMHFTAQKKSKVQLQDNEITILAADLKAQDNKPIAKGAEIHRLVVIIQRTKLLKKPKQI